MHRAMNLFSLKNRGIVLLVTLLFVFSLNLFSKEVRSFFSVAFSPFQSFFWNLGDSSSDFFSGIFRASSLAKENGRLESENLRLLQELITLQDIQKENESLRKALSLGIEKKFHSIPSSIVGKDPSQDTLFLNKGSSDGVREGMAVITPENVAVGKIGAVFERSSRLILLSHPESSFDAKIVKEGIVGVVRGQGRYRALLDFIPQESRVLPGDVVVSSSLGGIFPENLLIGEVKEVKTSDKQSFQQAPLSLFFDVRKVDLVFVIEEK
jgi:rod shape-determining protein MreC